MKKKILVCIHNPFAIDNLFGTLNSISDKSEITVITTNYLIDEKNKIKYFNFKQNLKLKNFFFIPFYKEGLIRGYNSIIKTHWYLKNLNKKINFQEFDLCLSDTRFFIWQRIILDKFLSSNCKLIGLYIEGITLPLDKFNDLVNGESPMNIVRSLHKLREPSKRKKNSSYLKKITNVYNRLKDTFFDRILLSILIHQKTFSYQKFDFNILETKKFDYKICFFFSSYYFWEKLYDKNKVFWSSLVSSCKCEKTKLKTKALFISTLWDGYGSKNEIIDNLEKTVNSFNNLKKKYSNIDLIDFKFHPMESMNNIKLIKDEVKRLNLIKVNFIENTLTLQEIACNYSCVIGVMSNALLYLQNFCKTIDVYCLKLLSEKIAGRYFYLKLINENIKIYDEINDNFINDEIAFKDIKKTKRYNFRDIIFSLTNE